MNDKYKWEIGRPPPIESHSSKKLELLKIYLDGYFNTVAQIPHMEVLRISFVDGFCGGGLYVDDSGDEVLGSPMVMLKAVKDAETRLNKNRSKRLKIDARYYFIDKSAQATRCLKDTIEKRGFGDQIGKSIELFTGLFKNKYEDIIENILQKQRSGRSIFVLDQYGYKDVPLAAVRKIIESLGKSEVILTMAVDWMIDYMSCNPKFIKAVANTEISNRQIDALLKEKGKPGYRFIMQRDIANHWRSYCGASNFTPFFIRSMDAHKDLWLIHLSKHYAARNVMIDSHWEIKNYSLHQGNIGFDMLGYFPGREDTVEMDFGFDDATRVIAQLQEDIPGRVGQLDSHGPVTIDTFQQRIANVTLARSTHLEKALKELAKNRIIDIRTPGNRVKQLDAQLQPTDLISLSRQLKIFD